MSSPEMAKLERIFAYNMDACNRRSQPRADRRHEAELAEAIITSEVERFEARLHTSIGADDCELAGSFGNHPPGRNRSACAALGALTPEQEMAMEALTRGIIKRSCIRRLPRLKTAAR